MSTSLLNYRKLAFDAYAPICVHCGFGIREVLEVAHLDGNRANNSLSNLAILCPTCHRMHDIDLLPTDALRSLARREAQSSMVKAHQGCREESH